MLSRKEAVAIVLTASGPVANRLEYNETNNKNKDAQWLY